MALTCIPNLRIRSLEDSADLEFEGKNDKDIKADKNRIIMEWYRIIGASFFKVHPNRIHFIQTSTYAYHGHINF